MTGQSETETEPNDVDFLKERQTKANAKKDIQFACTYDECNAVFTRSDRLQRHLRHHTGERPFVCPKEGCLRSFTYRSYLTKHLRRPHPTDTNTVVEVVPKCRKQYVCKECEKVFKSKFQLRNHCFQHFGEKPFECHECDQRFVTQTKLKSHLKRHEGYVCSREGCDYKAYKWTDLRRHVSDMHQMCHKCDICHKMFKSLWDLKSHKESIHLNVKIVCTYDNCDKTYSKKANLMAHIRSKHNNHLFKCTQEGCDQTFLHKKSLKIHLKNHSNPQKTKIKDKKVRRRVCRASQMTGTDLNEDQTKEIMTKDLQFRNECSDKVL